MKLTNLNKFPKTITRKNTDFTSIKYQLLQFIYLYIAVKLNPEWSGAPSNVSGGHFRAICVFQKVIFHWR